MKNETTPKPDAVGGMYYSKFFDAYISAEETGEYLAALPIEEQAAYVEAPQLEEPFSGPLYNFLESL